MPSKTRGVNGGSEDVEQSVKVNTFSANKVEVKGRDVSQEYDDDRAGILERTWINHINLRYIDRRKLMVEIKQIDSVFRLLQTRNISETNKIV